MKMVHRWGTIRMAGVIASDAMSPIVFVPRVMSENEMVEIHTSWCRRLDPGYTARYLAAVPDMIRRSR